MDIKGLTGAETLLRVLATMGVERIFASPGSEWAPVWEHLAKPYGSPHEIPLYLSGWPAATPSRRASSPR